MPRKPPVSRQERAGILRPPPTPPTRPAAGESFADFNNRGGRLTSPLSPPAPLPPQSGIIAASPNVVERRPRVSLTRIFGEGMVADHNRRRAESMRVQDIELSRELPGIPQATGFDGNAESRSLRLRLYSRERDRPLPEVLTDIASLTGASLEYLNHVVARESGGDSDAKPGTSGARGIAQFIPETWMGYMRGTGARYGWPQSMSEEETLGLRYDDRWSAAMGAEYARTNFGRFERDLAPRLGRSASLGDLYVMHFGDVNGLNLLDAYYSGRTRAPALTHFKDWQVQANQGLFFHRNARGDGLNYSRPLSVGEFYERMASDKTPAIFRPRRDGSTESLE